MYKIAVIGDYDSIYGFATLGLSICPVKNREEARDKLNQLASGRYGIIYITEAVAAGLKEEIERYQEQVLPAIIQIPGVSGNTGAGVQGVKKTVEQAVGSDILFGNESGSYTHLDVYKRQMPCPIWSRRRLSGGIIR